MSDPTELELARKTIKYKSQNIEEIGLGSGPLDEDDLQEMEAEVRILLGAIAEYRRLTTNTAGKQE